MSFRLPIPCLNNSNAQRHSVREYITLLDEDTDQIFIPLDKLKYYVLESNNGYELVKLLDNEKGNVYGMYDYISHIFELEIEEGRDPYQLDSIATDLNNCGGIYCEAKEVKSKMYFIHYDDSLISTYEGEDLSHARKKIMIHDPSECGVIAFPKVKIKTPHTFPNGDTMDDSQVADIANRCSKWISEDLGYCTKKTEEEFQRAKKKNASLKKIIGSDFAKDLRKQVEAIGDYCLDMRGKLQFLGVQKDAKGLLGKGSDNFTLLFCIDRLFFEDKVVFDDINGETKFGKRLITAPGFYFNVTVSPSLEFYFDTAPIPKFGTYLRHPHFQDNWCLGEFEALIFQAQEDKDLKKYVITLCDYFHSYNIISPYIPLHGHYFTYEQIERDGFTCLSKYNTSSSELMELMDIKIPKWVKEQTGMTSLFDIMQLKKVKEGECTPITQQSYWIDDMRLVSEKGKKISIKKKKGVKEEEFTPSNQEEYQNYVVSQGLGGAASRAVYERMMVRLTGDQQPQQGRPEQEAEALLDHARIQDATDHAAPRIFRTDDARLSAVFNGEDNNMEFSLNNNVTAQWTTIVAAGGPDPGTLSEAALEEVVAADQAEIPDAPQEEGAVEAAAETDTAF